MTALAAPRSTRRQGPDQVIPVCLDYPIADSVILYPGAMVALNSTGYAVPVTSATGLIVIGRCASDRTLDNTVVGHAAGALRVPVDSGVFYWANAAAADAVAAANRGAVCYGYDDQTVTITSSSRSVAGIVVDVDASGVWVLQGLITQVATAGVPSNPAYVISVPIPALSAIADAGVLARLTPGVAGRIIGTEFQVTTAVTTAAKLTTLTPKIGATPVGGGILALTSATCTPIGAKVVGTTVLTANSFGATDEITVVASSTTAFVEGAGVLFIYVG